jgi:hypothetical protein
MPEPLPTIPPPPPPPPDAAVRPLARLWFYWLVGLLVLACVALVVALNILSEQQRLTREKLDAARLRWREARITDYDIDVRVSGSAPGHYQVRVRGGQIIQGTMNGRPFEELRLAFPWTVTGMLEEVLVRELENLERPGGQRCFSMVEFDAKLGYPRKYLHTIDQRTTSWEVRLMIVPPESKATPTAATPAASDALPSP